MSSFQQVLDAAMALSPSERGRLVDQLLGDLPVPAASFDPPEVVRQELDRRIADIDANPDDEVPWETVKSEMLEELEQWRSK